MPKFIDLCRFMGYPFNDQTSASQATETGQTLLAARSPRLSHFAART